MAATRPEHAYASDRPRHRDPRATSPAPTTTGWLEDRCPVVSERPLHSRAAARYCLGGVFLHSGIEFGLRSTGEGSSSGGEEEGGGVRSGKGAARTILLLFNTISASPSKQPRMVGSALGVYIFGLIFVSARTNKRHHHIKMSPHISIGTEPVLAAHAPSPPAAGSHCPAREDSSSPLRNRISL
jgi:hypothetical protein